MIASTMLATMPPIRTMIAGSTRLSAACRKDSKSGQLVRAFSIAGSSPEFSPTAM
jgi:hypothetical protein